MVAGDLFPGAHGALPGLRARKSCPATSAPDSVQRLRGMATGAVTGPGTTIEFLERAAQREPAGTGTSKRPAATSVADFSWTQRSAGPGRGVEQQGKATRQSE